MKLINKEALAERARRLYTVPAEVSAAVFASLSPACRAFYTSPAPHRLTLQPHQLTDVQRYELLECFGVPNGIRSVDVTIVGPQAELEIRFYNRNSLARIFSDIALDPPSVRSIFPLAGGHRLPAGQAEGQVQAVAINAGPDAATIVLTVAPVGDYSTYTVGVNTLLYPNFDPLLADINFKFRPGCFNTNCAPDWEPAPAPVPAPTIDYLAKDYDSFRHAMIAAMMERVPGWEPSSEADLDQVLLELFSAAADELSDYQDRVMNEAYLATARKRVSLARHARLVDYHIHQGNQARTWVAFEMATALILAPADELSVGKNFRFWAGAGDERDDSSVVFMTRAARSAHPLANRLSLYTWSGAIPSLAAGSTAADIQPLGGTDIAPVPVATQSAAVELQNLIRSRRVERLLVEERLNPATGKRPGRDPLRRQLLRLLEGDEAATAMFDPLTGPPASAQWFVRVRWREEDALRTNFCFTVECPAPVHFVSLFHGNLVEAHHGRPAEAVAPHELIFKEPGAPLSPAAANEFHYERTPWGAICRLPRGPLAYRDTPPGGEVPPVSTLGVRVLTAGGADAWDEVPSLIHSDTSDENGDHFVVETDELGRSLIRFGNGVNGKLLPEGAEVRCSYQIGDGPDGNIGADKLTRFDPAAPAFNLLSAGVLTPLTTAQAALTRVWNPFDVTDGRAPEPAAEIIRRAPEAYRLRQLRAVTLRDYVARAEEVEGVSRAAAGYAWTGSWRTVRITVDPEGTAALSDALRRAVARHLETVRLIGEDLEIRPPRFVPLEIRVVVCVAQDFWPEDLRFILEQEFSTGHTPDGRPGFFHPDLWTFGQPLRASQIIGRAQKAQGVGHVVSVSLKRWNETGAGKREIVNLRHNEIIQVMSDPDHLERGFIFFELKGGRQ